MSKESVELSRRYRVKTEAGTFRAWRIWRHERHAYEKGNVYLNMGFAIGFMGLKLSHQGVYLCLLLHNVHLRKQNKITIY